jgi:translation initiation factor 1
VLQEEEMSAHDPHRLVWSDEQGGAVGDKPSKAHRKKRKAASASGDLRAGGFPRDGIVRVCREKSGRGGKTVTVLYGIIGSESDMKHLLKRLKGLCGCGGTLRGGCLEIQGDQREKILSYLAEQGIQAKAAGG